MHRTIAAFAIFGLIGTGCSSKPAEPPLPSADRMQADLMNKQLSKNLPVALTGGRFSTFSAEQAQSAPDAITYNVSFSMSDVQYNSRDFGPCSGSVVMSYTNSGQGWTLSNLQVFDELSCPQHDAAVAAQRDAFQRQEDQNRAQLCAAGQHPDGGCPTSSVQPSAQPTAVSPTTNTVGPQTTSSNAM